MRTNEKILWTAMVLLSLSLAERDGHAGPVGPLTTFTAGTTARASEVNGNFSAVKAAVDDNYSRIATLETNSANPNVTGNLTLVPSTATTGNILKGTTRFIHNFGTEGAFIGRAAGNFAMTGVNNTGSGSVVLTSNATGNQNTGSGAFALQFNTSGNDNTAAGVSALRSNSTGNANTATGVNTLAHNTTGTQNTAYGFYALLHNTTSTNNTAVGANALSSNTTGSANIALGISAGYNLTTGNNNIAIGNAGVAAESATIRIGSGLQNRTFISGIRGISTGVADAVPVMIDSAGQLGTVSSSRRFKDNIADMGEASRALLELRPVTFYYKSDQNPAGRTLQYGLIAEEVADVAPTLVARATDGRLETVFYRHLTPMLLNEFQRQQRTIEAQAAQLENQTARIAELERDLSLQTARTEALEKRAAEIAKLEERTARMAAQLERLEVPELRAASR